MRLWIQNNYFCEDGFFILEVKLQKREHNFISFSLASWKTMQLYIFQNYPAKKLPLKRFLVGFKK